MAKHISRRRRKNEKTTNAKVLNERTSLSLDGAGTTLSIIITASNFKKKKKKWKDAKHCLGAKHKTAVS